MMLAFDIMRRARSVRGKYGTLRNLLKRIKDMLLQFQMAKSLTHSLVNYHETFTCWASCVILWLLKSFSRHDILNFQGFRFPTNWLILFRDLSRLLLYMTDVFPEVWVLGQQIYTLLLAHSNLLGWLNDLLVQTPLKLPWVLILCPFNAVKVLF